MPKSGNYIQLEIKKHLSVRQERQIPVKFFVK
jgi:hypothetical protein